VNLSFEDIWRLHKRFILSVGGGLAALLVGLSVVGAVSASADKQRRQAQSIERDVEDLVSALAGREGFEAGLARVLGERVGPELRSRLELPRREAFQVRAGDSPYVAYGRVLELVGKGREEARRKGIACPDDLGLPRQPPEERLAEALAHADVAEHVLRLLVDRGVEKIGRFAPGSARFERLVETGTGAGAGRAEPPADELVLRRLPVVFEAVASADRVTALLADFQTAGQALEVVAAKLARTDGDRVVVACEVAALALVPAAEARLGESAAGGAPGGLRNRWRRR
jgi:hypothetical protein